jgi:hypothetical protein
MNLKALHHIRVYSLLRLLQVSISTCVIMRFMKLVIRVNSTVGLLHNEHARCFCSREQLYTHRDLDFRLQASLLPFGFPTLSLLTFLAFVSLAHSSLKQYSSLKGATRSWKQQQLRDHLLLCEQKYIVFF